MSLRPEPIHPVPEETARVARAAFPKGNAHTRMRDQLGTIWDDEDFAELFSRRGQPALAPWRLALVTVMQFAENLPDRRAAEAVRARIDWKFALGLELTDPDFDFSVLSEFRDRLLAGGAEQLLLEKMLERFAERGLVKARGKQRTGSTHVLCAVRALNRIELVGETMRAALNALAVAAPEWLRERAPEEWFSRYGRPVYDELPKGVSARKEYAETVGKDGTMLLSWIRAEGSPDWLGRVPAVGSLEKTWEDQYRTEGGEPRWREANELPSAGERLDSPYDPDARATATSDRRDGAATSCTSPRPATRDCPASSRAWRPPPLTSPTSLRRRRCTRTSPAAVCRPRSTWRTRASWTRTSW